MNIFAQNIFDFDYKQKYFTSIESMVIQLPPLPQKSLCQLVYNQNIGLFVACHGGLKSAQTYHQLIYDDGANVDGDNVTPKFRWKTIENIYNCKRESAITLISSDTVLICGIYENYSYNFTTERWKKLSGIPRASKITPRNLKVPCIYFDERRNRIYTVVDASVSDALQIMKYEIDDDEWIKLDSNVVYNSIGKEAAILNEAIWISDGNLNFSYGAGTKSVMVYSREKQLADKGWIEWKFNSKLTEFMKKKNLSFGRVCLPVTV